jgi:signal transduction histidine kinase
VVPCHTSDVDDAACERYHEQMSSEAPATPSDPHNAEPSPPWSEARRITTSTTLQLPDAERQRQQGLRWLAGLRWWALTGAMVGVLVSLGLNWEFVSTPAIVGAVIVMIVVNGVLLFRTRADVHVDRNELLLHTAVDLLMLTWLLAWAGGVRNPLSMAFSFHVVLGALLNGRRGALFSTAASLLCMSLLWGLEQAHALPVPELRDPPAVLWALALLVLVLGLGYLSLVSAERQVSERERAMEKQIEAEGALGLLLEVLTALRVGVDVQDKDGHTLLRNDANLSRTPPAVAAIDRAQRVLEQRKELGADVTPVTERFSVTSERGERVIELVALRPSHPQVAQAFLTVDRTDSLLVEQRHVMLERLATIGRAMQGVAHELNTPLTTMQTLGKDLRAVLHDVELPAAVRADVEESLNLIIEETRRCRSLTQSLLSTANESNRRRGQRQPLFDIAQRAVKLVGSGRDAVLIDEATLSTGVEVDADRVLQILMNLVQNALAASADVNDGQPRVVITAVPTDTTVQVRVRDRGTGLPEPVRGRLFEPFVTTKPEGTGLGLYTSQQLARELGGTLDLVDGHNVDGGGRGTLAMLTLPRTAGSGG